MTDDIAERVSVELSADEAKLIIAALRKFEPYWPADLGELDRVELLAGIRVAIDRVTRTLDASAAATR